MSLSIEIPMKRRQKQKKENVRMNNHSSGLPYGFQIMGRNFDEEGILSFSKNYF